MKEKLSTDWNVVKETGHKVIISVWTITKWDNLVQLKSKLLPY